MAIPTRSKPLQRLHHRSARRHAIKFSILQAACRSDVTGSEGQGAGPEGVFVSSFPSSPGKADHPARHLAPGPSSSRSRAARSSPRDWDSGSAYSRVSHTSTSRHTPLTVVEACRVYAQTKFGRRLRRARAERTPSARYPVGNNRARRADAIRLAPDSLSDAGHAEAIRRVPEFETRSGRVRAPGW